MTHPPRPLPFLLALAIAVAAVALAPSLPADPAGITWTTNLDDPPIGDPDNAVKGGTFRYPMRDYPLTFRLMGPNSNDAFAGWNRAYTMDFALVGRHPSTDNFIPLLASHWHVADDHRTVYYKLDPTIHWSDGTPITASDFVFTWEMMRSPHIVDPFYTKYAEDYFEVVEAIGDDVVKIVGRQESWRPLAEFNLWPTPRHATLLDDTWVQRTNLQPQVAVGPYVVTEQTTGQRVVFTRIDKWWGDDHHYYRGMFNPARIELPVVGDGRELDFFKTRRIDMLTITSAREWAQELDFEAITNGWAHKRRVFTRTPQGMYGLSLNLGFPLFQNKDVRKGIQHLFNFDELNKNIMFGVYVRQVSAFEGTEFANPSLVPYEFNPRKAIEHFRAAGFSQRGPDGILRNAKGDRLAFTVIYGQKSFERLLTTIQQVYRRAGVGMELQLLDGAAAFNRGLERSYEAIMMSRTAGYYPGPKQYFHSEFLESTNNNNIWGFGRPDTDKLIETYMFDMDAQARLDAMHELDAIIHDEAFYVPFWSAPFIRLIYWDQVKWPEFVLPRATEQFMDYQVFWIDTDAQSRLDEAVAAQRPLGPSGPVDVDYFGVRPDDERGAGE